MRWFGRKKVPYLYNGAGGQLLAILPGAVVDSSPIQALRVLLIFEFYNFLFVFRNVFLLYMVNFVNPEGLLVGNSGCINNDSLNTVTKNEYNMKYITIGGLEVSRIGLGAMSMSAYYSPTERNDEESIRTIHRAIEMGVTHIDTAEIYGPYMNEELVGQAIKGRRSQVVIATKFGLVSHAGGGAGVIDSKPENIRKAVEGSLKRLGTDYIDLYYQHRVDPKTPIEDTIGALAQLIAEGKIKHIGLSEAGVETIRRAHAVHPITALQSEYSLWARDLELAILPLLRELGIGLVPYSPLGRGFLTGTITSREQISDDDWRKSNPRFSAENFTHNLQTVEEVKAVATEVNATPGQVALAWLLAQGEDIAPIPGTKRVNRVEENSAADSVVLSSEQVERLKNISAVGERYSAGDMSTIEK
ncbi:Predicted oxidoreductase [Filimonas lacunae]|uniref:Predicted oxidoreductase n=1 Tax=Filimonas lacunae TaxID=477680 RepID=A0A1N7REV1_9BACT|nr:Predicted oxidoreductase [Filimonas lacunae]